MTTRTEKRAIYLIGMMASGKSTVGKALARQLEWEFFDVDKEIEKRSGVPISEIFELEGESGFRKRETKMMDELTQRSRVVIAMGGGAPMFEANRPLLKRGLVIQLVTTVEDIIERTRYDTARPLLQCDDKEQRIAMLLEERSSVYDLMSDLVVSTAGGHLHSVVDRILDNPQVVELVNRVNVEEKDNVDIYG
jgi:shikimate kinase